MIDHNPLRDCLLLRPAVVQLPSVFHRASGHTNNGTCEPRGGDTMSTSGSPSLSRKTRTLVCGTGVPALSPGNSPYQSPKMKSRNCSHQLNKAAAAVNGESESPASSPLHQQQQQQHQPSPRHQLCMMQQRVRVIVPKLTNDMQKGQCGRIGIFGGCIM